MTVQASTIEATRDGAGTDVVDVVHEAVAPYAACFRTRDFIVTARCAASARIEPEVLRGIVADLLSSACRRSHPAAPVRIRLRDIDHAIVLSVRDDSRGFHARTLAELRRPTSPPRLVDDAVLRAAWAARAAGARVEVDAPEGAAATVTIVLPTDADGVRAAA